MDLKTLDPFKGVFRYFLELLPIEAMAYDISEKHDDPLIVAMYTRHMEAINNIDDGRSRKIFNRLGIAFIYTLMDPVYGDPMRFIFSQIKDTDPKEDVPKNWRINKEDK